MWTSFPHSAHWEYASKEYSLSLEERFEFIATQSTLIMGWERVQLWEQIASLIYNTSEETAVQNSLTSRGECFTVQRATVHSVNIITGALTSASTLI